MTKENAHLFLPFVQALIDGKTVEIDTDYTGWENQEPYGFTGKPDQYRIKPEPVMVPLGPEDVPPGSVIRGGVDHWFFITQCHSDGIMFHSKVRDNRVLWDELFTYWAIKRPGEDWQPCYKPG